MSLQAVFFDMGGTIDTFHFTREHRISHVPLIRQCLEGRGVRLMMDDEQLADAITQGVSDYLQWNLNSNIELKPAEIWSRYFLSEAHISADILAPVAEELAYVYETRLYVREMRQEIPSVLERIKGMGLKIGCISNTQSLRQVPDNLKEYGIIQFFCPIVLSSEYGRRKPDPSIFYYAARKAGVPTGGCVFVGDKLNRDILGAQRSGFHLTVQILHEDDPCEGEECIRPDAIIESMTELVPLLEAELEKDRQNYPAFARRKIKAVFFDAGDILYRRPQKDMHLMNFLAKKTLNPAPHFDREKKRLRELAFSGQLGRHAYYEEVLSLYGLTSAEDISEGVEAMRMDDNSVEIVDGAPETIRELKARGFILGIITDTALSYSKKLDWFDQSGFGRIWDLVISSKEIGIRKPSPRMYKEAIAQSGVNPSEAVFVGHKRSELDGARAVGLRTIALNYEDGTEADVFIEDIRDLVEVPLLRK